MTCNVSFDRYICDNRSIEKIKPEESLNAMLSNDVKFDGNTLKKIATRSLSLDRPP